MRKNVGRYNGFNFIKNIVLKGYHRFMVFVASLISFKVAFFTFFCFRKAAQTRCLVDR